MMLEQAVRLCEIGMALALTQQSIEHLFIATTQKWLFALRLLLCLLLLANVAAGPALLLLLVSSNLILVRCDGPYNGGADRVAVLMQICLLGFHLLAGFGVPRLWQEAVLAYLALQIVLSYFMAGWVKVVNPEWRRGQALVDVFAYSAYPQSESLRGWARWPRLLFVMGWAVILFELIFPLSLLSETALYLALVLAAAFHTANALLFGLNRFVWIWVATYPSLIWLQDRLF